MTPLASTDPSDIANAARCFSSCVPTGDQIILRSYLLNQVGTNTGGTCVTPSSPTNFAVVSKTTTSITLGWKIVHNSGSLITSFLISYGTSNGGPYPNSSGPIPLISRTFTINGLTSGTTYFFVIQAVAFTGCVSANSSQASGTTTGNSPNANLNNSLTGYWPLNDGAAALMLGAADTSGNGFNLTAITNGIASTAGTGNIDPVADYKTNNANTLGLFSAAAGLNMVANQQFTACCWVNIFLQTANNPIIDNWGVSGFYLGQNGANQWTFGVHDGANASQFVVGAAIGGGWVFLAGGWDGANIWIQVNAGARVTAAVATTHAFTDDLDIGRYAGNGGASIVTNGFIGGCGLWFRSLSLAEVTQLYNGGNGLAPAPF